MQFPTGKRQMPMDLNLSDNWIGKTRNKVKSRLVY